MNVFEDQRMHSAVFSMYLRNWKLIALTVVVCTALAFVATLFMKERFRAKASFFVPFDISLEKTVEDPKLGYDTEADRMLQILNSEKLKDSVVKKFNLVQYFKIDTNEQGWQQKVTDKYRQRVFANRTNIMSIVVEAETYNPVFSAEIVNYIVESGGRFRQEMYRSNTRQAADAFKKEYELKKAFVDSLATRIGNLRKDEHGNYPLLDALIVSGNSTSSSTEKEILTQRFIYENAQLNDMRVKYENARNTALRPIPDFYNIDPAYPVYEASFPLKGFNLAIGFFGSLFFILVALYLNYVVKKLRARM
ncbi:MAG: hypothetical protein MUC87_02995 [Bacteroidia bacterium]|jgi:uncharacterized protein involved in exopolysaccharide biosynthesis|nr:hypothetical protein [Bacteroidia bacterium]